MRAALLTFLAASTIFASTSAHAEEGYRFPGYRRYGLRGDLAFDSNLGARSAEGFGGGFRVRTSRDFAYQLDFALLRDIRDASIYRLPLSVRALKIAANDGAHYELFVAPGLGYMYEKSESSSVHLVGPEIGFGFEHRIEDVWNHLIVELVLSARRPIGNSVLEERWQPTVLLRVGIMTTIGWMEY